jgi:hypothetical protein
VLVLDVTCEQLFSSINDRQAIVERHIASLVPPQQSAPIGLARGRMMRIRAAPIPLVKHTRLSETDRVIVELFDGEAQPADEWKMLGRYLDLSVQDTVAAQAASQAQRRSVARVINDSAAFKSHDSQYTPRPRNAWPVAACPSPKPSRAAVDAAKRTA